MPITFVGLFKGIVSRKESIMMTLAEMIKTGHTSSTELKAILDDLGAFRARWPEGGRTGFLETLARNVVPEEPTGSVFEGTGASVTRVYHATFEDFKGIRMSGWDGGLTRFTAVLWDNGELWYSTYDV
jgi:hypothetical protein